MTEHGTGLPETNRKVAALEKGQIELRENVSSIRGTLQTLVRDSDTLGKKFDAFVERQEEQKVERFEARQEEVRARTLTPERLLGLIVGMVVVITSILGGTVWLINAFVGPVKTDVTNLATATAERFNSQTVQLNSRFETFQDSIRSIREGDAKTASALADLSVGQGRLDDRSAEMEKKWEAFDRHDYAGENARQNAIIATNSGRLDRVEAKQEDRIRRELDNIRSDRDRALDRIKP